MCMCGSRRAECDVLGQRRRKRPSKALAGQIEKRIYLCSKCGQPKREGWRVGCLSVRVCPQSAVTCGRAGAVRVGAVTTPVPDGSVLYDGKSRFNFTITI